jgi:hypothetical protein
VRKLLDSFEIDDTNGKHVCHVHEALWMNFDELRNLIPGRVFNVELVRETLRNVLRGLYFLHEDVHVVHTGQPVSVLAR